MELLIESLIGFVLSGILGWVGSILHSILANTKRIEVLQNTKIQIVLVWEGKELMLPYQPIRKTLSRAELQGVLGMYGGFTIPKLIDTFLSGEFSRALLGESDRIRVEVPEKEFARFSEAIKG